MIVKGYVMVTTQFDLRHHYDLYSGLSGLIYLSAPFTERRYQAANGRSKPAVYNLMKVKVTNALFQTM